MDSQDSIKPAELLQKFGPYLIPGKINVNDWTFRVPLNYSEPSGETIRLAGWSLEKAKAGDIYERPNATSVSATESASSVRPLPTSDSKTFKPWIFWQEGGPGGPAPAPQDATFAPFLLEKGYRIFLLDQRGAGQSNTITARTLRERGGPVEQAAYLKHFRADNISRDIEAVRRTLTADESDESKRKISVIGQSFGGFVCVSYVSMFQDSLREAILFGGLPPLGVDVYDVYCKLVSHGAERSRDFYDKFPEDEKLAKKMVRYIRKNSDDPEDTTLLGGKLSETRFRAIGLNMGDYGGLERMHNIIKQCENDLETYGYWTRPTKWALEDIATFDNHVLYPLFLDVLYLNRPGKAANWPAERALRDSADYGKAPEDHPIFFYPETITHETYRDSPELRQLLETAEILNADTEWSVVWDEETLARNKVPVYAAVYYDDLFVNFDFSVATAKKIRGTKTFITNRAYHDGVRAQTEHILTSVFALRDETID